MYTQKQTSQTWHLMTSDFQETQMWQDYLQQELGRVIGVAAQIYQKDFALGGVSTTITTAAATAAATISASTSKYYYY